MRSDIGWAILFQKVHLYYSKQQHRIRFMGLTILTLIHLSPGSKYFLEKLFFFKSKIQDFLFFRNENFPAENNSKRKTNELLLPLLLMPMKTKHCAFALTAWSVGAELSGTGIKRSAISPPITCNHRDTYSQEKNNNYYKISSNY